MRLLPKHSADGVAKADAANAYGRELVVVGMVVVVGSSGSGYEPVRT